MSKLTFRQVVENALRKTYNPNPSGGVYGVSCGRWLKIMDWYELRYCNPNSPERKR